MPHTDRFIPISLLIVAMLIFVSGCMSPLDTDPYRPWLDQDPATWATPAGGSRHQADTLRNASLEQDAEASVQIDANADADVYARIALRHNPSILAVERRIKRLGARVPQVTSLSDPMFMIAPFGQMAETAAGEVGMMTSISQKFPYPGKLSTQGRIADQDVAIAVADLQRVRLQVVADTRRAYWMYYFASRAIETTRESRALLDKLKQIAEAEYKAGKRSQTDVLRASVELSNIDKELITLQERQDTTRSMLNQLMDRPIDEKLPTPTAVKPKDVDTALENLLKQAAVHNPTIRTIYERIEQQRHRHMLAKLSRRPDLTVSVNYVAVDDEGLSPVANGDDQWWLGFGVNLPIWARKYEAAEREALQGMLENVAELSAQRNRVAFMVQEAYLKVEAQRKLVALFDRIIIPQAKQTVGASASGYRFSNAR